jgi:hypothetical protein
VSYTPPSLTASGTTFPQLQSAGFSGILSNISSANAFDLATNSLLFAIARTAAGPNMVPIADNFLSGQPMDLAALLARLGRYSSALHALAQAADELGTLMAANPGTLGVDPAPSPTVQSMGAGGALRRTW